MYDWQCMIPLYSSQNSWILTLIHAGLVEQIGKTEMLGFSVRSIGCDDVLQLLLQLVRNDAECTNGHLIIGNVLLLKVGTAGELIEIIAWFNLRLNLAQHLGGSKDALLAEANILRIRFTLVGRNRQLIHGGAIAMQSGCLWWRHWRIGVHILCLVGFKDP